MGRPSRENPAVREFILWNVEKHPETITAVTCEVFGLSRVAINGYLKRLVETDLIMAVGNTKARRYTLKPTVLINAVIPIAARNNAEDAVWRFRIAPHVGDLKQNVKDVCYYGFTEILNNAMDHSGSPEANIAYIETYTKVIILVSDKGIGIFQKIQQDFASFEKRVGWGWQRGLVATSPR